MIEKLLRYCESLLPALKNLTKFDAGGQKIVFSGNHITYGPVVLKIIEVNSESSGQRAIREMEIASRLTGNHFAKVFGFGSFSFDDRDFMYIVEEFIDGVTLRKHLLSVNKMSINEVLHLGCRLLEALNTVHKANLVHRDLKPENIILSTNKVVLIDFGIARDLEKQSLTADIAFFGPMTIGYAAPEQIKNEKRQICNRTDLFAWGIILYECLMGVNPFKLNSSNSEIVLKDTLTFTPPPLLSDHPELPQIIQSCLNKTIHRRPPSADYILKILQLREENI
ncbi:serine/threonine protein kinase [Paenibacillus cellulositrophicus]|uniref:serine/threonine protein kinase n=1 Tax=Paenibacillus cellulositrophicus TaxID=562959 RepID=UPI003F7F16B9